MKAKLKICISLIGLFGAVLLLQAASPSAKLDFEKALVLEEAEGQLEEAIALYKKVVVDSADEALAAQAQLHIGICYERLGKEEARKAYQAVIDRYTSQQEAVRVARERLAHLSPSGRLLTADKRSGMVVRRVWVDPNYDLRGDQGAISPDGRYLTFVKRGRPKDLFVRDLASGENRRLTHAGPGESADESRVSPDGRQIAYQWDNSDGFDELRIIGIDGSGDRVLYRNPEVPHIHTRGWLPNGKHILVSTRLQDKTTQIAVVSVADGSLRVLKSLEWRPDYYLPHLTISPDGRYIAHNFRPKQGSTDEDIALLAVDGSREVPLVKHLADDDVLAWAPDGQTVLFRSDRTGTEDLWAIAVVNGKPQGPPQLVKKNIGQIQPLGFTRQGAFYYGFSNRMEDIYLATLDPASGKVLVPPRRVTERFLGHTVTSDWSPDGKYLAYDVRSGRRPSIIIRSAESGEEREIPVSLTVERGSAYLRWFPDGRSILLTLFRQGLYKVEIPTGRVTPLVQIGRGTGQTSGAWPAGWSPEGKALFYGRIDGSATIKTSIWMRNLETGQETELYHADGDVLSNLDLSPDGQQLALLSPYPRARIVSLISTSDGKQRELLKVGEAESLALNVLAWTPDGRYLLFGKSNPVLRKTELWRIPAEGGKPEQLELEMEGVRFLHFHPDGREVAFSAREEVVEIWALENFLSELRAAR